MSNGAEEIGPMGFIGVILLLVGIAYLILGGTARCFP